MLNRLLTDNYIMNTMKLVTPPYYDNLGWNSAFYQGVQVHKFESARRSKSNQLNMSYQFHY